MQKLEKNTLLLILVCVSSVYFLSACYINTSNDGSHYALVSALVNKKTVCINDYISYTGMIDYAEKNGNYYSDRLPGNAFLMLPFYAFGNVIQAFHLSSLSSHVPIQEVTVILLPNLCCVLALFFLVKLFLLFGFSFKKSMALMLVFAFSTLVWQESTHVFSHAPSMCFVLIAFYFLIKMPSVYSKEFFLYVAFLTYSSIIELQNLLLFLPSAWYFISSKKIEFNISSKNVVWFFKSLGIFSAIILLLVAYNYCAFGELTLKSNKFNPVFPEEASFISSLSGDFIQGLDDLFTNFSNPKLYYKLKLGVKNTIPGLFVTSPILIASLLGFYFFFRKYPKEALLFISIITINVLIGAFHKTVLVRHIFTIIPFLFFPLIFLIQAILGINKISIKYFLFLVLLVLIASSVFRVYYVTNTYWGRELNNIFPFAKEMGIYALYITFVGLVYLGVKKIKAKLVAT
jgi:hypothetical protein